MPKDTNLVYECHEVLEEVVVWLWQVVDDVCAYFQSAALILVTCSVQGDTSGENGKGREEGRRGRGGMDGRTKRRGGNW